MLIDKQKYKKSLADLWHTVFGDGYGYINLIFKPEYDKDILCFAELEGERAVSAFYLIKNTLRFDGKLYNGYYLYAAATLPEYRKGGIMSGLIRQAQAYCKEKETDFVNLVPSEESLYSYYSRFGFKDAMYRCKCTYKATDSSTQKLSAEDIAEAQLIRQSYDGNMIFTEGQAFCYCKDCLEAAEITFTKLSDESGALFSAEEKLVLEFISSERELNTSVENLKNKLPCGEWEINSPFELPFCEENEKVRYGMLYPLSDELRRDWSNTDIYMNIALD